MGRCIGLGAFDPAAVGCMEGRGGVMRYGEVWGGMGRYGEACSCMKEGSPPVRTTFGWSES